MGTKTVIMETIKEEYSDKVVEMEGTLESAPSSSSYTKFMNLSANVLSDISTTLLLYFELGEHP